ncbi:3167_t:CDS:2, partial [Acaulospora colombiana]
MSRSPATSNDILETVVGSTPHAQEFPSTSNKPKSTMKALPSSAIAFALERSNVTRSVHSARTVSGGQILASMTLLKSAVVRTSNLVQDKEGKQKAETTLASATNTLSVDKALEQLQDGGIWINGLSTTTVSTTDWPQALWSSNGIASGVDSFDADTTTQGFGFPLLDALVQVTEHEVQGIPFCTPDPQNPPELFHSFSTLDPVFSMTNLIYHPRRMAPVQNGGTIVQVLNAYDYVPRGPSLSFSKQTWWDTLLTLYSHDTTQATQKIFQDLSFISTYWLSHIHFGRFMRDLCDPERRLGIQPSLVLAILSVATLMKSSEAGLGIEGRKFALWLRDAAQASLDASVNASWIDPSLARAAFVRDKVSIYLLDSLIQAMNLTTLDAHDPMVPLFPADELPITSTDPLAFLNQNASQAAIISACPWHGLDGCPASCLNTPALLEKLSQEMQSQEDEAQFLDDLKQLEAHGANHLQNNTWLTFQWPDDGLEVQREEIRRLCWSSMLLAHMLKEYTPHLEEMDWDLYLSKQETLLGKAWIEATCIEAEFAKCLRPKKRLALNIGREFIF